MKSILFDFGGTLDSRGTTWADRFYAIYRRRSAALSRGSFDKAFYASDDALPGRYPLKNLGFRETLTLQVRGVLENLGPGVIGPELEGLLVEDFLKDSRANFAQIRPLLERLAGRYRLGVVSNFYGNLDSVLSAEGLRDLFDVVADSGVVGAEKPDPRLFNHAIDSLGLRPADCVMVGDSIPRDMRGAEGLGLRHALLARNGGPSCCPSAWRIATLAELEPRLMETE